LAEQGDFLHVVTTDNLSRPQNGAGPCHLIWGSAGILAVVALAQTLQETGYADFGFSTWRPTLYAYVLWAICLCAGARC
jgi:multiple sugar transport system permease protein